MWKGIFYNAISKYLGVLISLGVTAILSRILTPTEFGIVALVFVFIGFFNLLGNMGIGPAIVQTRDLTDEDISSIFTFSGLMALLLAIFFFLSGSIIANFYDDNRLIPVVRLLSLSVFFNIVSIVPKAINKKELRFKQMGYINISVQAVTGIIAIFFALYDFSYYALILQNVLTGFLGFLVFFYFYPIKFSLKIYKSSLKRIAKYSSYQFAFNFINYFSRNLDNILIGKYLGNASLGYYSKSYTLMHLPIYNLTHVITPVMHPVLAKHQHDYNHIYNSYISVLKQLAAIGFPLSIFLYINAFDLIYILFGPQWERSVPVFKILALSVGFQVCLSSSNTIFQATNRTNLLFISGLLSAIFIICGITYGVLYGRNLLDVGYGLLAAFIISFFLVFYMLVKTTLKKSFSSFLKIFFLPFAASMLTAIVLYGIKLLEIKGLLNLILNILIFGVVVLIFFLIPKQNRKIFRNILKKNNFK